MTHHDVVVVGGGPAGYAAALYGAGAGLNVGLVESHKLGGTCLHVGCIPAKELLETAHVFRSIGHAEEFGVSTGEPVIDFSVTQNRKQGIIDALVGGIKHLLSGRNVTIYDGRGSLLPGRRVAVSGGESGDIELTGDHVLLATGSQPRTIPGFEVDGDLVMTSDELLSIGAIPRRSVIIGGGAIGCEFASMLLDLGSEVTLLEALPSLIPGADADASKALARSFKKRRMTVHTGVRVTGHAPTGTGSTIVSFGDADTVETDVVVVSVGRRPTAPVVQGTGVVVDERGFIVADEYCRTGEPGVYALGDVIDTPQLAHVGFAEGMLVIKHLLGEPAAPIDYANVPWGIYCNPEIAFAGMTEQQATDAGYDVITSKNRFMSNGRAKIIGDTEGLVKVVAEKQPDGTGGRILGVHMVGPWVTEQLGQGYLAVNWEATIDEVASFIQPHPTLSELFGETVLSLTGRSLH